MKEISGNILDLPEPRAAIFQQVNTLGFMGAGLALQTRNLFPKMFQAYRSICRLAGSNNRALLGTVQLFPAAMYSKETEMGVYDDRLFVFMFAQSTTGRVGKHTDYAAFEQCLKKASSISFDQRPLYFPHGIGSGLGGGKWEYIEAMIEKYFPDATIVRR